MAATRASGSPARCRAIRLSSLATGSSSPVAHANDPTARTAPTWTGSAPGERSMRGLSRFVERPTDPRTRLEGLRRDAGELLTRVLPEPEAGLAAGILIGLRDRVDRGVAATFTTAGVSHIVAISGWNIAIVAAAIGAFAGRLGRRRRTVVTAAAIVAYIVFAGASPSVLRAGAMAGVVLFARETGRAGRAAAALGWAVALLLLVDPGLDRRRRLPALDAGDRRPHRLGDATYRAPRSMDPGAAAALVVREPRRLARGPGGDVADRAGVVRATGGHRAGGQPAGRPARRAGDGGRVLSPCWEERSSRSGRLRRSAWCWLRRAGSPCA